MKTTITVQSIHDGHTIKLTFTDEQLKQQWLENNAHNYVLKRAKISKK
jgi:hypothetical protein